MAKYINDARLTNEIIEEIITKCGFELIKHRYDERTGEEISDGGIIRMENMIMVTCKNMDTAELAGKVFRRFPVLGVLNSQYSFSDEIIMLEDFFASRMKINDELEPLDQKLFDEYYNKMCEIMGEEYERDAQAEFEKIRAEEAEKEAKSETENQEEPKTKETEKEEPTGTEMGE